MMNDKTPSDLVTLRDVLSDHSAREEIGLLCTPSLVAPSYDATPRNCLTFAGTGGDGVHFSLLGTEQGVSDASPVVMTVPMSFDQTNLVVGANLRDFLGLGIRLGYFCLEQLVYNRRRTVLSLNAAMYSDDMSPSGIAVLKAIEKALGATPWVDHDGHLTALQTKFQLLLDVPTRG